jgi:tRNA/rRNA methyltransferase
VVLVETAGPLNLGSVARLCANYEPSCLRLVNPRCELDDPLAHLMAVHGRPWLGKAETYGDLAAAVADCRRVVACSGRVENQERPHHSPKEALEWLLEPQGGPSQVALVFGREDHGLHNNELQLAGRLLRIPTAPTYGSLNLSHAVAICLAEIQQLHQAQAPNPQASPLAPLAAQGQLEQSLQDAEALLLEVGFLYPHTAKARMAKLRNLLLRAEPNGEEVALLRGMVRQLRWAIGRDSG